jgi:5-methylcytosine-specific restriction endonuclease McrA
MTRITREAVTGNLRPDAFSMFDNEAVERIASHFDIPTSTAADWNSELGDFETLTQNVGASAPDSDRYLTLVRRREWLPYEREAVLRSRTVPAHKWLGEKAEKFSVEIDSGGELEIRNEEGSWHYSTIINSDGLSSSLYAEHHENDPEKQDRVAFLKRLERTDSIIREYTRRYDSEWISLAREEQTVRRELSSLYRDVVGHPHEESQKKAVVKRLKESFPYLRLDNRFTARIADCSISYARRITYTSERGAESRRAPSALKREVRERDDGKCVVCGDDGTVVHHVIPHSQGGPHKRDNLALLCDRHHEYAHGRGKERVVSSYDTVEYDSREEFWNDWIETDFDDYELLQERRGTEEESVDAGEQSTFAEF